jgi:hypothetical protein
MGNMIAFPELGDGSVNSAIRAHFENKSRGTCASKLAIFARECPNKLHWFHRWAALPDGKEYAIFTEASQSGGMHNFMFFTYEDLEEALVDSKWSKRDRDKLRIAVDQHNAHKAIREMTIEQAQQIGLG